MRSIKSSPYDFLSSDNDVAAAPEKRRTRVNVGGKLMKVCELEKLYVAASYNSCVPSHDLWFDLCKGCSGMRCSFEKGD